MNKYLFVSTALLIALIEAAEADVEVECQMDALPSPPSVTAHPLAAIVRSG